MGVLEVADLQQAIPNGARRQGQGYAAAYSEERCVAKWLCRSLSNDDLFDKEEIS